jgi:LacI family transcriptional regulator
VLYDREMPTTRADAVLFDHVSGVKSACTKLFELGHTRIALALWSAGSRPVRRRIEGYRAAYRVAGMESPELILRQPTPTSSVFDDLLRLLDAPDPPTALIAQGTHILVTALRALARAGLRVPQDFSVVSIGDSDFTQTHDPAITVLRTNAEVVANQAKSMLLDRLSGAIPPTSPPRKVMISYDLVMRDSCGPCPR